MQTANQIDAEIQDGTLTYHHTTWMRLRFPEFPQRPLGMTEGDKLVVHVEVFRDFNRVGGFEFEQSKPEVDEQMIRHLVCLGRFESK
jgi:hypothetical protein